jgi:hypothetical protein
MLRIDSGPALALLRNIVGRHVGCGIVLDRASAFVPRQRLSVPAE